VVMFYTCSGVNVKLSRHRTGQALKVAEGLIHTFRFSPGREITVRARAQLGALKHLRF